MTEDTFALDMVAIYRQTLDGRLLDCNEACARILGIRRKNCWPPDASPCHVSDALSVIASRPDLKALSNVEIASQEGRQRCLGPAEPQVRRGGRSLEGVGRSGDVRCDRTACGGTEARVSGVSRRTDFASQSLTRRRSAGSRSGAGQAQPQTGRRADISITSSDQQHVRHGSPTPSRPVGNDVSVPA